jgi:membrane protein DedA with SNARE-associated domain
MRIAELHPGPEGYLLLFAWVFAEQIGLPIPAAPALLAAGALAGRGSLHMGLIVAVGLTAAVLADYLWYCAGSFRKERMAAFSRRHRVIQTGRNAFERYGGCSLVFAKFVPGLSLAVPILSGMCGMGVAQFLVLDTVGALVWVGVFAAGGFLLGRSGPVPITPHLCLWLCAACVLVCIIIPVVTRLRRAIRSGRVFSYYEPCNRPPSGFLRFRRNWRVLNWRASSAAASSPAHSG